MEPPKPLSAADYQAVIRSPPETVNDAHDFLDQVWQQRTDVSDNERMIIETILSELVTNVIQNNPHREVFCDVRVRITPQQLLIETSDTGDEASALRPDPEMPEGNAEHGRGLPLIYLLADDVEHRWQNSRNLWRVSRSRISEQQS
ncbi:ATP-binding protein [Propionicimonas sp.]|uniref:ATP-binding protein n=1 Tax=Propionicimonas sp. TaxID=1955623 RepID=UPI0018560537|nr:ATP-binding protein [Propionicimonas sp.]MBU3978024.1 ATP-binding protein [Actinomycetota bacterium]MBA3021754.1 ATP-binding protein [Propionicimonas sp.]MBU3985468.1 ATP-binding protein [Actinomycetota bacterium]MBU4007563.1 ATP-binding protein [Actinomycetota bacterium]MBU4066543.1 ATP-binding protein [Actinomycetota bacterium]